MTPHASDTEPHYDLAILGTGSGNGIPTEEMEHWSVAIIEPWTFGGTCLNRGCIPSKMFVHAADVAREMQTSEKFGVHGSFSHADWPAIRDRVFGRIDPIANSGEDYRRGQDHITVYDEPASFVGPGRLRSGATTFTADRIILAAGSRPFIPDIAGVEAAGFLTSDTIMRIDCLPDRLVVIGGGAVASEMAHVFSALGSDVTMVVRGPRLLTTEEPEIGEALTQRFRERGITVHTSTTVYTASRLNGTLSLGLADGSTIACDELLIATGRVSNGDQLDLAAAGIQVDALNRPIVDEVMRTNVEGVWALGDLTSHHQDLKHLANAQAKAIRQSLLDPESPSRPVIPNQPRATFTDPEVASVGLGEEEAREAGHDVAVATRMFGDTAYGWALEDTTSFVKVVLDASTGLLLGAHIIGPAASILLQPLIQAMTFGQTAGELATQMVWPHPALTEVIEQVLIAVSPQI